MLSFLFRRKSSIPTKSFNEIKSLSKMLQKINSLEEWARNLKKEDYIKQTHIFINAYKNNTSIHAMLPKAFALVREAARRTLGERMFDAQILGGIILHQGRISEMKTGEGKTLTSTTAAYLNSLTEQSVHIVTVNDYLAKRDALWMNPVFEYLGRSVGYVISEQDNTIRKDMYQKNIVYATNNELGFDYLRDNLRHNKEAMCSTGYNFCIIDEIDSVLIDEARTPLIISGPSIDDTQKYVHSNSIISFLNECKKIEETNEYPEEEKDLEGDYKLNFKNKSLSFTPYGIKKIESVLQKKGYIKGNLDNLENFEYTHYVTQSLKAHKLFVKDVDYIVQDNKVEIVDEFTGRVLHGRRYSDGLHQAIEAKENIKIAQQNKTLASITFQNFFKMYSKLSGMTGTAATEEKEFLKIYGLDVVEIPTNRPIIRDDKNDLIFVSKATKINAIVKEISRVHQKGQPILIGTASIESSEELEKVLKRHNIPCNVLNAKNHEREAFIIAEAGKEGSITIATNMAGRGTDIKLGGQLQISNEDEPHAQEEALKKWRKNYKKVKTLGGLYILGTERHESRRIDNQLRGRSGRQGDPGESLFYLSLDDQLMQLFGRGIGRLRNLMLKTMDEDEPLYHPIITRTMERAQKNVEERNFEIRKHLLEFDSILNEQRNILYKQRENILCSDNLLNRLEKNIEHIITNTAETIKNDDHALSEEIISIAQEKFLFQEHIPKPIVPQDLITLLKENIKKKAQLTGGEIFNEIIRTEYLHLIDSRWQDHINSLEDLRQAVYLRSYAQKNPLLEYKLEGFELFDEMLENIVLGILRSIIGLRIDPIQAEKEHIQSNNANYTNQHKNFSLLNETKGSLQPQQHIAHNNEHIDNVQIIRSSKKVGRNSPCPCGSEKKYKHCCGKSS